MRKAEDRFARIWAAEKTKWMNGDVAAVAMENGATVPVDYCLSTVARLRQQAGSPIGPVAAVIRQLGKVAGRQFFYPADSLHVSLLGCTPRTTDRHFFGAGQINRIDRAIAAVLDGRPSVRIALRGLNVVGSQVFVQCFPFDDAWAQLRGDLEQALLIIGEQPIVYEDKSPIHLNIMRVTDGSEACLSRTLECIERLRDEDFGVLEVSCIEFLMTDFVVSSANTEVFKRYHLRQAVRN